MSNRYLEMKWAEDLTKHKTLGTCSESGELYLFDMKTDCSLGGILLRFWSDSVLTVVYLINRLSSSILNGYLSQSSVEAEYRSMASATCEVFSWDMFVAKLADKVKTKVKLQKEDVDT
ncbi:hypothetical protein Tco_0656407 [Tanacetum coccineum]|uniref:Uncharacterized protein n=1 Tax=Tanacetum coccineum TaxID=301880 RepID=A0ABQ4X9E2_9ASTR